MIEIVAVVSAIIGYLWGSWGAMKQIRGYREALGMNPDPLSPKEALSLPDQEQLSSSKSK